MPTPRFLPRTLLKRRHLVFLTMFSALKSTGLILVAYALATWIAKLSTGEQAETVLLWVALGGALLRTLGVWGLNSGARWVGAGAKEQMRSELIKVAATRPGILGHPSQQRPIAETSTLASHGIEKLDDYFTKFIPALIGALTVPVLLGVYILSLDWLSAVILLLTIPLVPLFMALIGMHTQETIAESQTRLDALANQLFELAQGLPALWGLGRAKDQGQAIAQVSERYRWATMNNLRTVFMSSFWLELISTLSVAVLAVLIGVRLVSGNMDLAAGLTILILAPELFNALREVGSAYHAADDGLAAYARYEQQIHGTEQPKLRTVTSTGTTRPILEIQNLNLHYQPTKYIYEDFSLSLHAGEQQILNNASGSGKTSLLKLIAETHSSNNEFDPAQVSGSIFIGAEIAVISQHPQFNEHTGAAQLAQDVPEAPEHLVQAMAQQLNLVQMLSRAIAEYSPGQLRRLEVLRALLRVHSVPECTLLLADEPTAHLDEHNAHRVRSLLAQIPTRCATLIASHDPLITGAAARVGTTAAQHSEPNIFPEAEADTFSREPVTGSTASRWSPRREVISRYASARHALGYGVLATVCAVALAGLSGWLIVEASYQPAILHLSVAFVMVRTLGIGRAIFRYLEQLAIHDAVLSYAGALRAKLWNAMVANPAHWGVMSRSSIVLRYLLAEVDELRDGIARVLFPPLQASLVWLAASGVLFMIQPEFGYLSFGAGLLLAFPIRWLVKAVEGRNLALQLEHRLEVNQLVLSILRNKEALRIYGSLHRLVNKLRKSEQRNTERTRRHAYGQGSAPALAALTSVLLAVLVVSVSHVDASLTALAVLVALSLGESAANALNAIQQARALQELTGQLASRGLAEQSNDTADTESQEPPVMVHGYRLNAVELSYIPGQSVVKDLNAEIRPGQWTALTGASGSGKSTVMTALLGALPISSGTLEIIDGQGKTRALNPNTMSSVAWCPQEAHLFDSTLRRNLNLAMPAGKPATDEKLIEVLHRVGLGSWYELEIQGLDTRIGSGGHRLSGGQRCKLAVARALLGGQQMILLDEPTAHLGEAESVELIETLRLALAGRTVLLITHDQKLAQVCEGSICLDRTLSATY